jgi:ribosomal protein S18 acetylase RimI-like enzyme
LGTDERYDVSAWPVLGERYRARVAFPSTFGRPTDITAEDSRWFAWHEASSHALSGREVRLLGDAVMLYDDADRDPFWNRVAGIEWPRESGAFDRRLAEIIALFAGLDRIPHVWPTPGYDEPPDLVARLLAHGFEDVGSGLIMVLDPDKRSNRRAGDAVARTGARSFPRDVEVRHIERPADPADASRDVSLVLLEAFAVETDRRAGIERETEALFDRDEVHVCLVRVDGEPAAVVRRSTFGSGSYLSSIGTRPAFRGRGLGRLVTDLAVEESLAAGTRWTYLGVFPDNHVAIRIYESLGFVPVGGPSPDLLLRS